MRKVWAISADPFLEVGSDDGRGGGDVILGSLTDGPREFDPREDRRVPGLGLCPLRHRLALMDDDSLAVGHADFRVRVHQPHGSGQRLGRQKVVGGEQDRVIAGRP